MNRTSLGMIVGLALGFAVAFGTFGDMLIVALFGVLGFGIVKISQGDVDVVSYLSGRRNQ